MNVVKLPMREQRILARLHRLFARRDAQAARLAAIDTKIAAETRSLAQARGTIFLRPENARREADATVAA